MKILQLCKKFPYPLKDGESIAIYQLAKSLSSRGAEISLLAMNTSKHYYDLKEIPQDLNFYHEINTVFVDNKIKIFDALINLFGNKSYHIQRFISDEFSAKLIELLKTNKFDIIQLETIYLAPYIDVIRKYSKAKIVLRSHNVEYEIWERISENTHNIIRKRYLKLQSKRLKRFEIDQLAKYDYIIAISKRDEMNMRQLSPISGISTISVGIEINELTNQNLHSPYFNFGFIGSLDWMPNLEGITWFLNKVAPALVQKYKNIRINIAGRNSPSSLMQYNQNGIHILGEVEDAHRFISDQNIMIVPLFSGSGMRIKILEAMALSKVVITTSIGLEGINAVDGKEVLIAENDIQFIEKIKFVLENPEIIDEIGNAARKLIIRDFNRCELGSNLIEIYEQLLVESQNRVIVE